MSSRAGMDFEVHFGPRGKRREQDEPMRIIVIGNFSGGDGDGSDLVRHRVGVDTLDNTMSRLAPRTALHMALPVSIQRQLDFARIEDFHPDHLLETIPELAELLAIRRDIANTATEQDAFARLAALTGTDAQFDPASIPATDTTVANASSGDDDTFERLLGSSGRDPRTSEESGRQVQTQLDKIVQEAVKGATREPRSVASEVGAQEVTDVLSATLRAVLHNPRFQALESNWRGVDWLVHEIEDDQAQIELVDLSWPDLVRMFEDAESVEGTALHRALVDIEDTLQPDVIVALYTIERDLGQLLTVSQLGALAGRCGATLTLHGALELCGCDGLEALARPEDWQTGDDEAGQFWDELRAHPVGEHIILAGPRFMLRQAYATRSDPIAAFDFSELSDPPQHGQFCWGNPGLLLAYCAALEQRQIDQLPSAFYDVGGEAGHQPPTEALVPDRAANKAAEHGLLLLRANRSTGAVTV